MSDDTTTELDEAPEVDEDAPNLAELSIDELSALEDALVEQFTTDSQSQDFNADHMDNLRDTVAAIEIVREEAARRVELASMSEAVGSTSVAEFAEALQPEYESVEGTTPEVELASEEANPAAEETVSEEDTHPNPTDVTDPQEFTVTEEAPEAEISPEGLESTTVPAEPKRNTPTLVASADIPGFTAGQELNGVLDLAEAFIAKRGHVRGTDQGNDGYQYLVASMKTRDYDEQHTLGDDAVVNQNRIEEGVKAAESLVAAGGIKTMLTPYYELTTYGDAMRPVRDSLVGYKAERGGIRFIPSPVIGTTAGGANVYAESVDASATPYGSPNGNGKGTVTVSAGPEQAVKVDIIPRIMRVGNLMARTYPEMVAAWTKLLLAQHARVAETNLLDKLVAGSTAISAAPTFGVTRSLLPQVDQLVAGFRSRHRLGSGTRFRAIFPFWVKDMVRTDIGRQLYGQDLNVSDAQIESYFSTRGLNVTWHYDQSSTTSSIFSAQAVGGYNKYPTTVEWFLFPEGTWLFLDGGTLDLGLVRDSTLNSVNDYTVFAETFESAAKVGIDSYVVNSTLHPNGSAISTTAATGTGF